MTPAAVLPGCATAGGGVETPAQAATEDAPSLDEAIEQSASDIASKLPQGTRVAVVAFDSPHGNLSGYIMDELAGA